MNGSRGFTLIEVLSTGVISTMLAGILLTLLYAAADQAEEMVPRQKVMTAYNIVSEQIHSTARKAVYVRSTGDAAWATCPPPNLGSRSFQDGLLFYDRNCAAIGGYQFSTSGGNHYLREWNTATSSWQPFRIIADTLWVTPGNKFGHTADRKNASFEIHLKYYVDGALSNYKTPTETAYLKGN